MLIAAALTAGIGLTLSKIVVSGNKGQGAVAAAGDINNLKNLAYLAFSIPAACINNFQASSTYANYYNTNTFTWGGTPVTIQLTKGLWYPNNSILVGPAPVTPPTPQVVPVGTFGSGLTVSALNLVITKQLNPSNYYGAFHIEATKSGTTVSGATTFSADVPVLLGVTGAAPSTITSCSTSQALPSCVPPAWFLAGTGTSIFCISAVQPTPANISNAMAGCAALGAHLCFPEEWLIGCNSLSVSATGFDTSGAQFVNYNTGCNDPACFDTMGPGCVMAGGADFTGAHPYRCCHN